MLLTVVCCLVGWLQALKDALKEVVGDDCDTSSDNCSDDSIGNEEECHDDTPTPIMQASGSLVLRCNSANDVPDQLPRQPDHFLLLKGKSWQPQLVYHEM